MRGFYLMHRGWLDNPAFGGKREPYCRRSAWAWLIEHAGYQDHEIMVGGKPRQIARGQLFVPMRELAREWGWAEAKVRRFFQVTHQCRMTECVTDALGTLVTICNYEKYQDVSCVGDAPSDAPLTHHPTHSKKKINKGKEDSPSGESPPPIVPPHPEGDTKTKTRRQAGRIDPEWAPNAEGRSFAASLGLDPDWVGDEFRDFWLSVPGAKGVKADWNLTFKNRCRSLAEQGRGQGPASRPNGHQKLSAVESLYLGGMRAADKRDAAEHEQTDCGDDSSPLGALLDFRRLPRLS